MSHYHIRSCEKAEWHWAGLDSRAEAEKSAILLVPPAETYIIEESDESCPRCAFLKTVLGDRRKSGWQETVFEAFTESRPDFVRSKGQLSAACDRRQAMREEVHG